MYRFVVVLIASLCGVIAQAAELKCSVSVNLSEIGRASVELPANQGVTFYSDGEFELKITAIGAGSYELEVFDRIAPTRGYARAKLAVAGDRIGWSFWERERLLEVDCAI